MAHTFVAERKPLASFAGPQKRPHRRLRRCWKSPDCSWIARIATELDFPSPQMLKGSTGNLADLRCQLYLLNRATLSSVSSLGIREWAWISNENRPAASI